MNNALFQTVLKIEGAADLRVTYAQILRLIDSSLQEDGGEEFTNWLSIYYYGQTKSTLSESLAQRVYEQFRANLKATPGGDDLLYNTPNVVSYVMTKADATAEDLKSVNEQVGEINAAAKAWFVGRVNRLNDAKGQQLAMIDPVLRVSVSGKEVMTFRNRSEMGAFVLSLLDMADKAWGEDGGFNN